MTRLIASAAVLMLSAAPAFAGCWSTEGKPVDPNEPKVVICYAGECGETTPSYMCGNATSARYGFADGWAFELTEMGDWARTPSGQEITNLAAISCYSSTDDNSCPPIRIR